MNYELKTKINTTEELLNDLATKGWQEIEYLQTQIANLAESPTNEKLRQLFKNLLTSYYIFTGGIETLASEPISPASAPAEVTVEKSIIEPKPEPVIVEPETFDIDNTFTAKAPAEDDYEPFEYFVDFDEPVGVPLTDDDLYNN